jgi:DNA-binding MarR family transcriptional regulator
LEVSDSVLSKHIAALEDAGYVKRRIGVHRGRRTMWSSLTARGRGALKRARRRSARADQRDRLSPGSTIRRLDRAIRSEVAADAPSILPRVIRRLVVTLGVVALAVFAVGVGPGLRPEAVRDVVASGGEPSS